MVRGLFGAFELVRGIDEGLLDGKSVVWGLWDGKGIGGALGMVRELFWGLEDGKEIIRGLGDGKGDWWGPWG